ncbi:MAG: hypothetical protein SFU87_20230 [Chitinophagaceae bacterium]|nr:hypothetical protein [Chitinophagaceae bacterium]
MKLTVLLIAVLSNVTLLAQSVFTIEENKPVEIDGIEYGFIINNESKREVGDRGTFSRYEVTAYALNKSNCSRIILYSNYSSLYSSDENAMARFDCTNATGYRLTSKSATLRMGTFYVPVKKEFKDDKGKTQITTENVQAGYIFRKGQTIRDKFTVIVPLNEKPAIQCSILNSGNVL